MERQKKKKKWQKGINTNQIQILYWNRKKKWFKKKNKDSYESKAGDEKEPYQTHKGAIQMKWETKYVQLEKKKKKRKVVGGAGGLERTTHIWWLEIAVISAVPFIRQVCFVANQHDNDITSSLRSDIIYPLWGLLEGVKV